MIPRPININPIISAPANKIAKMPTIIRNRVTNASKKHRATGFLMKQPSTSNRIPAIIVPMVMKARPKPVANKNTPRPIRIKPSNVDAIHKNLLQGLNNISSPPSLTLKPDIIRFTINIWYKPTGSDKGYRRPNYLI